MGAGRQEKAARLINFAPMNLSMNPARALTYTSPSQMTRVVTEGWAAQEMYCCACPSNTLTAAPNNCKSFDFTCPVCKREYQLKSRKNWSETRVLDGEYKTMLNAVSSGSAPNLLIMQYTPQSWTVKNLLLIPSFFFTPSVVIPRNPLSVNAVRAGYIGCNLSLSAIASDGKLRVVDNGNISSPQKVRDWYQRVTPLATVPERGWVLDVLQVVRSLNKQEFALAEIYAHKPQFEVLHPDNNNIEAKIRQQLQKLRKRGFLEFLGSGNYRVL